MVFDSQFHKVFTFPPCGIVLDHFRPRPPRKRERCGQVESDPNKKILLIPGPDLACQDAVIESEALISSENSCISTFRRARAGLLILSK